MPDQNTWKFVEEPLQALEQNEYRIKNEFISLDPAMRGWIEDRKSYIEPVKVGNVMRAATIGRVIESKNDTFKKGDWVVSFRGVQSYAVSDGKGDVNLGQELVFPPEKYLSVLGLTGYTAYFGLLDVGKPAEGECLVVSAAAGAVGSIVGQIGKILGLKVVGIAGGQAKCQYLLDKLNFDHAVDYKSDHFAKEFIDATSDGVDVYFDNVGGEMLDFVLTRLNKKARVVICGAISQYNSKGRIYGPSNYLSLLVNRARMEGFVILDYQNRFLEAAMQLSQWIASGKLQSEEHILNGIENFPEAFTRLFTGDKRGKLMIKV